MLRLKFMFIQPNLGCRRVRSEKILLIILLSSPNCQGFLRVDGALLFINPWDRRFVDGNYYQAQSERTRLLLSGRRNTYRDWLDTVVVPILKIKEKDIEAMPWHQYVWIRLLPTATRPQRWGLACFCPLIPNPYRQDNDPKADPMTSPAK